MYPVISAVATVVAGCILCLQDPVVNKTSSEGFVLKAGEHDLAEVINDAARFLGRNHILDARELGAVGNIELQKSLNLDALGCEDVVSQLAYSQGLIMTPIDEKRGIYEFIAARGARHDLMQERSLFWKPEQVLRRPHLKVRVTTGVQLKHLNSMNVANYLRPWLSQGRIGRIQVSNVGGSQSLVLSGFCDQVSRVIQLLETFDTEANAMSPTAMNHLVPSLQKRLSRVEKDLQSLRQARKQPGK